MKGIQAQCRICHSFALADEFKLHAEYKKMVCPKCYSGKTKKEEEEKNRKVEIIKPLGWDSEDDYLEKAAKIRQQEVKSQFKKIAGTDQVECVCFNCKYKFKYNPLRNIPRSCPYCGEEVPNLKTFDLL